jgi:hypothetical protein
MDINVKAAEAATEVRDPGFKLMKSSTLPLTPELVARINGMTPSPTERLRDDKRMEHLRAKAALNLLVPFQWATAKFDGVDFRMNGQHSSAVLLEMGDNLPSGLKVHLDEYTVKNKHALAILFRQFDDRKSGRTPADVAGAHQNVEEALRDVKRYVAKLAAESVTWYRKEYEKLTPRGGDDRYTLFEDPAIAEFIVWLDDKVLGIKTPELEKTAVIAALYGTYLANQDVAKEFWIETSRGGDRHNDTDPALQLDTWLKGTVTDKELARELGPKNYFQACIHCWNASRQGKPVTSMRYDHKKGLTRIYE